MQYSKGQVGRVFMVQFDHHDDILQNLKEMIIKEDIRAGWIQLLGGIRSGEVVTGPEEPTIPPVPVWNRFSDAHELVASGSILWNEEEPVLHMHGAMGNKDGQTIGCMRKGLKVYLLIEAVIFEFSQIDIRRKWYEEGEFYKMKFEK